MFILRASVLEVVREVVRDLLAETAPITELIDRDDSIIADCGENEFSSLEEFKSVFSSLYVHDRS